MASQQALQTLKIIKYLRNLDGTLPAASGLMRKTSGAGYFPVPTGPAVGTGVTAGVSGVYGNWTQLLAAAGADLLITGVVFVPNTSGVAQWAQLQLGVGAALSESAIATAYFGVGEQGATLTVSPGGYWAPRFPIPIAAGQRISARLAHSLASGGCLLTLECINAADLLAAL